MSQLGSHRAVECRMYENYSKRSFRNGYFRNQQDINGFDYLRDDVECYKCKYFGHLSKDCRLGSSPKEITQNINEQIWKNKTKRCVLTLKAQRNSNVLYVDKACSMDMPTRKNKFISLKENKDGTMSFVNDVGFKRHRNMYNHSWKKGCITKGVLLVDYMNHNFISVGRMCDQGHTMLFNSKKCAMRKGKFGKIVATTSRASNDIYIFDETPNGCFLANEDEMWVWKKRMGHINFENLVKIRRKEVVREMPKILKPSNMTCRSCQHGK